MRMMDILPQPETAPVYFHIEEAVLMGARPIHRGDIYYADLSPTIGSEQGGVRPVLIIQNDVGNQYSPTVIAAAITGCVKRKRQPTHVHLYGSSCGLFRSSTVLLEQIRTLDKSRLREYMGNVGEDKLRQIDLALRVSIGPGDAEQLHIEQTGGHYA